jgi:predicted transcriptional regulator
MNNKHAANHIEFPNISSARHQKNRKEWEATAWSELVMWFTKHDAKTLSEILESLTTQSDRSYVIKRAVAMARFQHGATYREIGRELWLTQQTIRTIKKTLSTHSYVSNWERAKAQKEARIAKWLEKRHERPEPKIYRRTKYGKMRIS